MEILLNAGIGVGFLMFILLLSRQHKSTSDYLFLGWILVTLGQIIFYSFSLFQTSLKGFPAICLFGLPLLASPFLFLYIKSLTRNTVPLSQISGHLSIYPLYCLALLMLIGEEIPRLYAKDGVLVFQDPNSLLAYYYAVPMAISGLLYAFWSLHILRKHRKSISDYFSFEEEVDLNWLTYVVYSFFIFFLITFFLVIGFVRFQNVSLHLGFGLVGITLSFMLMAIGFYGFRQTQIFSFPMPEQPEETEARSYARSGLNEVKVSQLKKRLDSLMEEEKGFLDENLNLSQLSEKMRISPPQLSQVLNQGFGQNFYDYVNSLRVEEVKKRMISGETAHLSILGIAFDCGFKSKSSFNRHFKKHTGKAPSDFLKTK